MVEKCRLSQILRAVTEHGGGHNLCKKNVSRWLTVEPFDGIKTFFINRAVGPLQVPLWSAFHSILVFALAMNVFAKKGEKGFFIPFAWT